MPPAQPPLHFVEDVITFSTVIGAVLVTFTFFGGCFYLDVLRGFAREQLAKSTELVAPLLAAAALSVRSARDEALRRLSCDGLVTSAERQWGAVREVVPRWVASVRTVYDSLKYRLDDSLRTFDETLWLRAPGLMEALTAGSQAARRLAARGWAAAMAACGRLSDKVARQYHQLAERDDDLVAFDVTKAFTPHKGAGAGGAGGAGSAGGRAGTSGSEWRSPLPPLSALLPPSTPQFGGFTPQPNKTWVPPTVELDA